MSGLRYIGKTTHLFYQSIIFREIPIINITYGVSKTPSTWRSPFLTLLQTGLELLQHMVFGNKCHCLFEVVFNRCIVLLPHISIVVSKLASVLNIAKHQVRQFISRWFQFLVIRNCLPTDRESRLWLLTSP